MEITVTMLEKVVEGIMSTHMEYKVSVKTDLERFKSKDFEVIRRYKDFVWLREQLRNNLPGYLIPPLPEKAVLNRFNAEFLKYRTRELERFLKRIVAHPMMSQSSDFVLFLESPESLVSSKAQTSANPNANQVKKQNSSGGLFSFLGSSIETISNNFGSYSEPDQWFDAKRNYYNSFESHLTSLAKATSQIIAKQRELTVATNEFATVSSLLAASEADQDAWVSASFNRLSDVMSQVVVLDERLANEETEQFEDHLRDHIRILGAVKEMLEGRTTKLATYQSMTKQLDLKKEKLSKLKGANPKMEKEIEEYQARVEEAKNDFQQISELVKDELNRFEASKLQEFKNLLAKLCQININHGLVALDQWKRFMDHIAENQNQMP